MAFQPCEFEYVSAREDFNVRFVREGSRQPDIRSLDDLERKFQDFLEFETMWTAGADPQKQRYTAEIDLWVHLWGSLDGFRGHWRQRAIQGPPANLYQAPVEFVNPIVAGSNGQTVGLGIGVSEMNPSALVSGYFAQGFPPNQLGISAGGPPLSMTIQGETELMGIPSDASKTTVDGEFDQVYQTHESPFAGTWGPVVAPQVAHVNQFHVPPAPAIPSFQPFMYPQPNQAIPNMPGEPDAGV